MTDKTIYAQAYIIKKAQTSVGETKIVTIEDGSFAWDFTGESEASKHTLEKVTCAMHQGDLIVISGPVAAGMSTLLKGFLGETPRATGVTLMSELDVAYCDQTVWLQNTTIRDNIIAYSSFDEALYSEVIYATALDVDLESWPEGDRTLVGSNGAALSGGQKRRIVSPSILLMFPSEVMCPFKVVMVLMLLKLHRALPVHFMHGDK